ncbi:MAG: hypothetical protein AAFR21_04275 [Pseudomonadota bacterium]
MLLRRVADHVQSQNWLAVGLDFFIVVAGVFIGIQLGNWNEGRQVRQSFTEAQKRLVAESQANAETTDQFLTDVSGRLSRARAAIDILRTCTDGKDAEETLLTGMETIRGTATLRLRQTALSAITGEDDFLSLLEEVERERLKELERRLTQAQQTLDWLEDRPFTHHIEDQTNISYGDLIDVETIPGVKIRRLTLNNAISEICRDEDLHQAFYLWERTATFQHLRGSQVRGWVNENARLMGGDTTFRDKS